MCGESHKHSSEGGGWKRAARCGTSLAAYPTSNRANKRRTFTHEFETEVVKLVTEQSYSVAEAARSLGIHENRIRSCTASRRKVIPDEDNDSAR